MQTNTPELFVKINELNYTFVAGMYDDSHNFKVIDKKISISKGIKKKKFTDINEACETIKKNIEAIEDKINFVFKEITVIIENFEISCVNVSGFKKLNGSQVLKENISYILNLLKLAVIESEAQKTILHIFNSKSILDGINVENLPIGLYGDFYSHELTFFLIQNNDLKNIKQVFNKNNLEIKKIFLKEYSEGVQLIKQNESVETFFKITINKENSNISFFSQAAFRYTEDFNFGTNIILKDISKVCSLKYETVENILSNIFLGNKNFDDGEFIEKKYFLNENYRKIRKKLITDIVNARIEEIINIIYNKNINIRNINKNNVKIYASIKEKIILDNFEEDLKFYFSNQKNSELSFIPNSDFDQQAMYASNLSIYGWKKEALPVVQGKNSIITRIFKSLFS